MLPLLAMLRHDMMRQSYARTGSSEPLHIALSAVKFFACLEGVCILLDWPSLIWPGREFELQQPQAWHHCQLALLCFNDLADTLTAAPTRAGREGMSTAITEQEENAAEGKFTEGVKQLASWSFK